jgi:hypothetical protein
MLTGVGAMRSPRYASAGLLFERDGERIMFDGGPGSEPTARVAAWLVTDEHAELIGAIRALARGHGVEPIVGSYHASGVEVVPRPVVHTSHLTVGYLVCVAGLRVVWAPEFLEFPIWAAGADLMFADAAGWERQIRFARGTGGHAAAQHVAVQAQRQGVRELVFAHIGRPTIRAIDAGLQPVFGRFGQDGETFLLSPATPAAVAGARR